MQKGEIVTVEVIAGRNLPAMDQNGLSDPYVIVQLGSKKMKTKVIRESLNPSWQIGPKGELFNFDYKIAAKATEIVIKCMDWDKFSVDDRMGMVVIPMKDLADHKLKDDWFPLVPQKPVDAVTGDLHLRIQIKPKPKKGKAKKKRSELWVAVKEGNLGAVKEWIPKHSDWSETDAEDSSLLHLAANRETFTADEEWILRALLENPKTNVNLADCEGNTPLHIFCKNYKTPKCEDLIELYIKKGADVNAKNSQGETPLHFAVFNPSLKVLIAECLLKAGANPDIQNCQNDTPVHYSVDIGRTDLVKLFVSYNANFDIPGSKECIPMVMAKPNKTLSDTIRDSLELSRWLKSKGFEKYIHTFLDQELYLYLLQDLEPDALASVVPDKEDREQIILKAKNIPGISRKETFARKQALYQKRENAKKKETELRTSLVKAIQDPTQTKGGKTQKWEIDINDIEFVKCLGKGTSGEVFRGLWCGKTVAIKVLTATNNTKELEEFIREFSIMINVNSPYIVQFFGASLVQKLTMVMEFCERGSLYHVLRNPECLIGWGRALDMLEEIVKGIKVLHDHKPAIMHRDLKTLNVLVTQDYHCRIADFGLSRFDVSANDVTMKKCRGTYAYISPEVYGGKGFVPQSDVYSISIMMWEFVARILSGEYEKPYSEYKHIRMEVQILVQAAKLNLRPTFKPTTPPLLKAIVEDCWAVDPPKRPVCGVLLDRLQEIRKTYEDNKEEWDKLAAPVKIVPTKSKQSK